MSAPVYGSITELIAKTAIYEAMLSLLTGWMAFNALQDANLMIFLLNAGNSIWFAYNAWESFVLANDVAELELDDDGEPK